MANAVHSILMVGSITGQTQQRFRAFSELGFKIDAIRGTADNHAPGINYHPSLLERVFYRLGYPEDKQRVNQQLIEKVKQEKFNVLWVEKCLCLWPKILRQIKAIQPNIILVWYSGDDMFARHNQSAYFRTGLSLYDLVVTTKSYNCDLDELPALGAKRVYFVDKGFDKHLHAPIELTEYDRERFGADVGFIGTFEQERASSMLYLAEHGIKVRIWGNGWQQFSKLHPHINLQIENKPIYVQDYQKAICATKINLCFLRKLNRDLQTDRTMEIPACSAFMLAERTTEHLRLFEENKEAVFFDNSDNDELLTKVKHYLAHDEERLSIALAGYQRCHRDDYSHEHRLRDVLKQIEGL